MTENGDNATEDPETRIAVVHKETGKVLMGEDTPKRMHITGWLEANPGWEIYKNEDDEDGSEEDSNDEDGNSGESEFCCTAIHLLTFCVTFTIVLFLLVPTTSKPLVVELKEKDPDAIPVEVAKNVIQQAKTKAEDDEYKNQGELTYYGYTFFTSKTTIIREEKDILVNPTFFLL